MQRSQYKGKRSFSWVTNYSKSIIMDQPDQLGMMGLMGNVRRNQGRELP